MNAEERRIKDAERRYVETAKTPEQAQARRDEIRKTRKWRESPASADPANRLKMYWGNVSEPNRDKAITAAQIDELTATGAKRVVVNFKPNPDDTPERQREAESKVVAMIAKALPSAEIILVLDEPHHVITHALIMAIERAAARHAADRGQA